MIARREEVAAHFGSVYRLTHKSLLTTHFSPSVTSRPSCSRQSFPCLCSKAMPVSSSIMIGLAASADKGMKLLAAPKAGWNTVSPPTHPVLVPVRYMSNVQVVLAGVGGSVGSFRELDSSSNADQLLQHFAWNAGGAVASGRPSTLWRPVVVIAGSGEDTEGGARCALQKGNASNRVCKTFSCRPAKTQNIVQKGMLAINQALPCAIS